MKHTILQEVGLNLFIWIDNRNLLGELAEKAGDKVQKDKKENEEEEEKEEEEKYTVEHVEFNHYPVENSGKTLKQKPNVLMVCKLESFGYTIEQKIYAEAVSSSLIKV